MPQCPACGLENPPDAPRCEGCGLAAGLFDAVKAALGSPEHNPEYPEQIGAILTALGEAEAPPPGPGQIATPARFPSAPSPQPSPTPVPEPPRELPKRPALGPGPEVAALRVRIDEYLRIGRREGLELGPFQQRARQMVLAPERHQLEALDRDLFVHLSAALSTHYELLRSRRDELGAVGTTRSVDAVLDRARRALAEGDLNAVAGLLREASDELERLEQDWATAQILVTEADLLAQAIRDLDGDPEPAMGPVREGRRLARAGEREAAENMLARATLALWAILSPRWGGELAGLREALIAQRAQGRDVRTAVADLRELAGALQRRNFGAAVLAYRRLRERVEGAARPAT